MNLFAQMYSQITTLFLFRRLFKLKRIIYLGASFPAEYLFGGGRASLPIGINLLVTPECNLKCAMCHFGSSRNASMDILSIKEIRKFINEVAPFSPSIFLSGGEPLMRKDFLEILALIKDSGLRCGFCTNGTLLTPGLIKEIIRLKVDNVVFSFHGSEEIHDRIVGVPGAYRKSEENVKMICGYRHRPSVIINSEIAAWNIEHIEEIAKLCQRCGADGVRFEYLNFLTVEDSRRQERLWEEWFPGDRAKVCTFIYDPSSENKDYASFPLLCAELRRRYRFAIFEKPKLNQREIGAWYSQMSGGLKKRCFFIWRSLFIAPNGDVYPCQFIMYKLGNIREMSFSEIWNGPKYRRFRRKLREGLFPVCARCCKL